MCKFIQMCCGEQKSKVLNYSHEFDLLFKILGTHFYAFEKPGIGQNLTYMAVIGVLCFLMLLVIEYRVFESVIYSVRSIFERKLPPMASKDEIDNDVDDEKKRIEQMSMADLRENNLVLQSLSKFYGKLLAVNRISIGVKRYRTELSFTTDLILH